MKQGSQQERTVKSESEQDVRKSLLFTILFIASISMIIATTLYNVAIFHWTPEAASQLYQSLIAHTAEAPMRYRILVPYIIQSLGTIIPGNPQDNFLFSYFLYYHVSIAFALFSLYGFFRFWYSRRLAFTGILITAVSLLAAYGDGFFQPWSILEIGLFTVGLIAIYKDKSALLAFIILISSLNRETGIVLCLAYLLAHISLRRPFLAGKHIMWGLGYFVIWAVVFIGLRLWLGFVPQLSLAEIIQRNLMPSALVLAGVNLFLFLGALWILVYHGYKTSPDFIRNAWRVVPVYLVFFLVFGIWQEIRLLSTLYPILVATILSQWDTI